MRPSIPTPTELQEKIAPLLMESYRAKRALTKEEIALIKEATGNPDVIVTIHHESELPNGKWRYTRQRDAEKILSLTIWIRTHETVIKATEAAATATESVKATKTVKPKLKTAVEPVDAIIPSEDSTPIAVEGKSLVKTPRVKTAKPKAEVVAEPVETFKVTPPPATLEQSQLEAEALPVTETPVNSTPTPKAKRETASKSTSVAPTPNPTVQGQLSLW